MILIILIILIKKSSGMSAIAIQIPSDKWDREGGGGGIPPNEIKEKIRLMSRKCFFYEAKENTVLYVPNVK